MVYVLSRSYYKLFQQHKYGHRISHNFIVNCLLVDVNLPYKRSIFRHVMLSAGKAFTEEMWQISGVAMETALDVSTFHLRQLMLLFHADSDNFYGDIAQVKVAMRRDSTPQECHRLRHLAHQVRQFFCGYSHFVGWFYIA
jgi:brefeldin A-inhibited guanine nucleotide-exchange protein 3